MQFHEIFVPWLKIFFCFSPFLGGSDSDASTQFSLSNASEYPETPDNNSTDDENDSVAVNNESDDEDDDESDIARFSDSDSD